MLFGPSDSESPSTAGENQENRGTDEIRLLAYRKAYGPTPLLEPADLQYLTQHEEVRSETTRVVPSRARSLDVVDDDDEMYSSYDADDSASGTLETLSVDQDFKVVRGIRSEFRESYGYSTDESESGEAPSGGRSSRAGSVYSFHSSVDSHLFRDFYGRKFNTLNPAYHLPADMEEHERLNIQHRVLCLLLNNLYPAENIIENILSQRQGYTPMIIDIGAGSGIWAIEMATKFPHCEVVGLDLVPPNLGDVDIPPNCRFEVDDANLSLTHYASTFDLVQCRAIEIGIQDWEAFMYNVAQILKPGGLLLVSAGNTQFLSDKGEEYRVMIEGQPGFRWIQKWFSAIHEAILPTQKGRQWAGNRWHDVAESNPNYRDVTSLQLHMPIGNWLPASASSDLQYAAELTRYNFIRLFRSQKPRLISRGLPESLVDRWRIETVKELLELKVRSMAAWNWMWCIRTDDPWVPVPEGPNQL